MSQWKETKRRSYLEALYNSYGRGDQDGRCSACQIGKAVWRCQDCHDTRLYCVLCFRTRHSSNPMHRVEKWTGRYFERASLWQVGVKLFLGHNGGPCPLSADSLNRSESQSYGDETRLDPEPINIPDILRTISTGFSTTPEALLIEMMGVVGQASNPSNKSLGRRILQKISGEFREDTMQSVLHNLEEVARAEGESKEIQSQADAQAAEAEAVNAPSMNTDPLLCSVPIFEELADADDEEWEDMDVPPLKRHLPRFLKRAPLKDGLGNEILTIVHNNGFHSLPVVWCKCKENLYDRERQLLAMRLYPSTFDKIKTVFTFACLDGFRINNLECKTSHYQYHQKLKRLTCPEYPDCAPDRYNELRRVVRQWRNLKYRKWFAVLNDGDAPKGSMALFCAACPQPGVNLPENWKADYEANPYV